MQRTLVLLILLLSQHLSFAQCENCYSLEEALRQPEKVKSLTLRAASLTEFPAELTKLVNLEKLDLSMNLLWELNPDRIQLPALKELNLANNPGISVIDLEGIGKSFPGLKNLDLSNNQIRHLGLGIRELERLEHINLGRNFIEFMPEVLGELRELKTIDVSDNQLKDAIWLNACWKLETLHIQNNPDVNLDELGLSLLEKDHLSSIQLSPSAKGVPAIFASLPVRELHFTGGQIDALNGKLRFADSLTSLILEACRIDKPQTFFESLNACPNIGDVEFIDMVIPKEITLIKHAEDLYFDKCEFENTAELRSIKPQIDIHAVNCDVESEDFVGNAKIARTIEVEETSVSDAMLENRVESIISPVIERRSVNATEASVLDLGFSSYDIPANAFLRQDGSLYEGEVELQIKEYDDPIITALDGVPMVYRNGNESELFASSGMIEFRAYDQSGEALQPNPSNPIEVTLQDVQPEADNRLYVFNDTTRNWQDIGRPLSSNWDSLRLAMMDSLNRLPDSLFFNYRIIYPNFVMNYKKLRKSPDELSFVAHNMTRFNKQFYKAPGNVVSATGYNQLWIGKGKNWIIDTMLTLEQRNHLSEIASYRTTHDKFLKYAKKTGKGKLIPRVIYNLNLIPNLEDDNYTLSFMFKDERVELPVYESWESSVSRTQLREKKMDKAYGRALRNAARQESYIARHLDELEERTIAGNKARIVENAIAARMRSYESQKAYNENLRFGLTNFGLINCDRLYTMPSPDFLALNKKLKDQNNEEVEVPKTVRYVLLNSNSYVEIPSSQIPYANGMDVRILFKVGEDELAIGKLTDGNSNMPVYRISANEYSPQEIYAKIRSL